ncbi:MAG: acyltransferase [Clostridia bacterium]|nr:acyltransferase [Clostridia bacterium]
MTPEITPINDTPLLTKAKPPRNAVFELLRIISMLLIVAHHFLGHGGWSGMSGVNSVLAAFTSAIFRPSVNVFVMISAYFMCTRDNMRMPWSKLGKLWLTVFFYSIIIYTAFTAAGVYEFSALGLVSAIFPICGHRYWFVSAYFIMMMASPLLNALVHRLKKSQHAFLCIILIILAGIQDLGILQSTVNLTSGYSAVWFCFLYLITAYIRKYDVRLKPVVWIIGSIGFAGVIAVLMFVWRNPGYNAIATVYMSLFILLAAKEIKITNKWISKAICLVSGLTFGIYLIHDSDEMRGFMYERIFHSSQFIGWKYAYLIYLGFVLATFAACAIAEWLRQLGFKGIDALAHRLFGDKIQAVKTSWHNFITRIVNKIDGVDKIQDEKIIL